MKQTIIRYLSAAALLLTAACTRDAELAGPGQDGQLQLTLSVGVADATQTRADEAAAPEISDGTRATTLIYALYREVGEGRYEPVQIPGETAMQVKKTVAYPYELSMTLVKGPNYVLAFWAQSANGDAYYNTADLQNIMVNYDDPAQLNNDEARDAFCATYAFNGREALPNEGKIWLRRPFAQINVGISRTEWNKMLNGGVRIDASSMNIQAVGRRFDLVSNTVLGNDDVEGNTQKFTIANYAKNGIPFDLQLPAAESGAAGADTDADAGAEEPAQQHWLKVDLDGNGTIEESEEFVWVSMGYVLTGSMEQSSTVDITTLKLYYDEDADPLSPPGFPMMSVPVQANYRTNILFDEGGLTGTAKVVLDLNRVYDNDYTSEDGGETWNGEIAEGVHIESYRGSDEKQSHYGSNFFWVDFYVSNGKGLQWIADRSNGVPLTEADIPTWTNKEGKTITYKRFQNATTGEPDLAAYKTAIFEILKGHALSPGGANTEDRFYRTDAGGNLIPWTFDDSSIILMSDIDWSRDEATTGRYWAPIASKLAHMSDENNSAPNYGYGFKGEFDGNGHTITHLRINNAEYNAGRPFYDETKGENTNQPLAWEDAAHNAGLIAVATDYATVKNLRLYDAEIVGEWNVGGLVGYYNANGKSLTIAKCQIENSRISAISSENNHDNDANCGGLVGSVNRFVFTDNTVVNATLYSDFVVGGLVGVHNPGGYQSTQTNCTLKNSTLILDEYNTIGNTDEYTYTGGYKTYVERSQNYEAPNYYGYVVGDRLSEGYLSSANMTCDNITLNIFYNYSKINSAKDARKLPSESDRGHSTVKNMPLNLFPMLDGKYGRSVTLDSHISGTPSYVKGAAAYGLYIDLSEDPDWYWAEENEVKTDGFTLAGTNDVENDKTEHDQLYSLNVVPDGSLTTYGVGITGDKGTATIRDLIISGDPTVDVGIYLDGAKTVVLDNIAVYDVSRTIADNNVPSGATLSVRNSDLRGNTEYSSGYAWVTFTNTVFYMGSGTADNRSQFYCKPGCATTFDGCIFRAGMQFDVPDAVKTAGGAKIRLILKDCQCGSASLQEALTNENLEQYKAEYFSADFFDYFDVEIQ